MRAVFVAIPSALLFLAACAPTMADRERMAQDEARNEAQIDKALAGLTPGKAQDCIDPRLAQSTETYGNTILYKNGRNLIYRNDTSGGCFGLSRDDIIVTKSYTGQLCHGDIVRTVDRGSHMQSGSCTFGSFVPYRKGS